MDVILNTTVLSNFASVGALNLIKSLFGMAYTTHEVHEEILRGYPEDISTLKISITRCLSMRLVGCESLRYAQIRNTD